MPTSGIAELYYQRRRLRHKLKSLNGTATEEIVHQMETIDAQIAAYHAKRATRTLQEA